MLKMFRDAVEEYGTVETGGSWLLPNGELLGVFGNDDHRIVGQFCETDWKEFIANGAWSLHHSRDYMWIRRNENFNVSIQLKFQELYETYNLWINELQVDIYSGLRCVEHLALEDGELIKLYLTDRIAYNLVVSDMEGEYC